MAAGGEGRGVPKVVEAAIPGLTFLGPAAGPPGLHTKDFMTINLFSVGINNLNALKSKRFG